MRFHIFESSLKRKTGHYYEYDKALIDELKSNHLESILYCNLKADQSILDELHAVPLFSKSVEEGFFYAPVISYIPNLILLNTLFFFELHKANQNSFQEGDVLLFTSLTQNQIFGIFFWYISIPKKKRPFLLLLFRMAIRHKDNYRSRFPVNRMLYKAGLRFFNKWGDRKIRYLSDTESLAREYEMLAERELTVMPIPHLPEEKHRVQEMGKPVTFAFLGPAREEKGFHLLPKAMELLITEHPEAEFLIQSSAVENAENIRQAIDTMKRSPSRVEFIEIPLDTDRYYDLIRSADCILVPYAPDRYQGRSSGVFAEAIAIGRPVITTRDTWMAENVLKYQCGVLMEDFSSAGLAKAMKDYIDNKKEFDENAVVASTAWRGNHGAKRYIDIVLSLVDSDSGSVT